MSIQEKIDLINSKLKELGSAWSVDRDCVDYSAAALPGFLLKKELISESIKSKISSIGSKTNFYNNKYRNEKLNNNSILYVNLLYNILFEKKL